jgi:hypothetical protein
MSKLNEYKSVIRKIADNSEQMPEYDTVRVEFKSRWAGVISDNRLYQAYHEVVREQKLETAATTQPHNWRNDKASTKQIGYIRLLGVELSGEQATEMTKGKASQIIESVKRGDGAGAFGLTFVDGSN